jgi:hypothetical protein
VPYPAGGHLKDPKPYGAPPLPDIKLKKKFPEHFLMVQLNFTRANEKPEDHIKDMTLVRIFQFIWVHPKYFYFNEAKRSNYNWWK